jgi:hypothetical protein
MTALGTATMHGFTSTMRSLISAGANVSAAQATFGEGENTISLTALDFARARARKVGGAEDIIALLTAAGGVSGTPGGP